MYKYVCLILFIVSESLASLSISTVFQSKSQALRMITQPSFFKNRIYYLDTSEFTVNQNLDIDKESISWPVEIKYHKKHRLQKLPFLVVPSMLTTEVWYLKDNYLQGNISTPLIKMLVVLKPQQKELIYLNINTTILYKNIVVW